MYIQEASIHIFIRASKETDSTSNISPELVDEEDYDDLLMQPVHLSMYDANEEEVHAVPDEMTISNTVESEQEADTDAPPPTPQETNEDPAISDKPSIKFSPINTVPATNVRRPTKERTPFRRERKNEKFAYIKVRVITSHGRIPEISIRNKYQLKAQSVCRRHHIVVSGAGSHICIDCRKETFDEKDYICNRTLDSSLGKFSYRTNQRNGKHFLFIAFI